MENTYKPSDGQPHSGGIGHTYSMQITLKIDARAHSITKKQDLSADIGNSQILKRQSQMTLPSEKVDWKMSISLASF
jgi:hypothetical protein